MAIMPKVGPPKGWVEAAERWRAQVQSIRTRGAGVDARIRIVRHWLNSLDATLAHRVEHSTPAHLSASLDAALDVLDPVVSVLAVARANALRKAIARAQAEARPLVATGRRDEAGRLVHQRLLDALTLDAVTQVRLAADETGEALVAQVMERILEPKRGRGHTGTLDAATTDLLNHLGYASATPRSSKRARQRLQK